jgi:predicted transcriptional regulator
LHVHDNRHTVSIMTDSLTIRLDARQRRDLHRIASALGQSDSEFVRGLIERGIAAESAGERLRHLAGGLKAAAVGRHGAAGGDGWAKALRERNWRN